MRLFNNHSNTNRLPMKGKVKRGFRTYCAVVIAVMLIVSCFTVTAFAADGNGALTAVNNLSTFIFGLIRAIGLILTGFGVVQIGLSLKSHDPSQRANGFLTLAGGVIITLNRTRGMAVSRPYPEKIKEVLKCPIIGL